MLNSYRLLRRFLFVTACAWGLGSTGTIAAIRDDHAVTNARAGAAMVPTVPIPAAFAREQSPSGWLGSQWAGLSPEQREQMRNQVREHRQRTRDDYRREERRDVYRAPPPDPYGGRQQRMSPEEREEFRQWMRERRDGERGNRGRDR